MGEWKTMETAPKDWSDVLLYLPDADNGCGSRGVVVGWFDEKNGHDGVWMRFDFGDFGKGCCNPSHWMPLPSPPEDV